MGQVTLGALPPYGKHHRALLSLQIPPFPPHLPPSPPRVGGVGGGRSLSCRAGDGQAQGRALGDPPQPSHWSVAIAVPRTPSLWGQDCVLGRRLDLPHPGVHRPGWL